MASFRKRNDKWEYRVRYKEKGKYKEKSKGGFKTKKEAQLAAAKVEEKVANGNDINSSEVVFNEYLPEWLEVYKKGSVSPGSYKNYEKNIRVHLLPEFGEVKLKDFSRKQYQTFINVLLETLSKSTVNGIHVVMHNALENAVNELEILDRNPANKITIKEHKVSDKKEEIKCYDIDELNQFLECALKGRNGFKYYSLFTFLSRTGLRIGECLALQWDDIDFEKHTVNVNKTFLTIKRTDPIKFGPTKNDSSNRIVTLDNSTLSLLKKIKTEQNKAILKNKKVDKVLTGGTEKNASERDALERRPREFEVIEGGQATTAKTETEENISSLETKNFYKDYDFVFTHKDGSCLLYPATVNALEAVCENGNFRYIGLHGFRHSHAVHLLQSGANIKYVSERLGHSTIDMTANVYLHITKSMEETAVSNYDNFLKSRGQIVGE